MRHIVLCIYNHFSALKFQPMLLYAWKTSGFLSNDDVVLFKNVDEILLQMASHKCSKCSENSLIKNVRMCSENPCVEYWIGIDGAPIRSVFFYESQQFAGKNFSVWLYLEIDCQIL